MHKRICLPFMVSLFKLINFVAGIKTVDRQCWCTEYNSRLVRKTSPKKI